MEPRDVIKRPIITEKSTTLMEQNKYTFEVDRRATKTDVRNAVERLFNVTVEQVNTMNVRGKMQRRGMTRGRRPDWKKAIVKLAPGDRIEIFEGM